jgi:hypothetical protein
MEMTLIPNSIREKMAELTQAVRDGNLKKLQELLEAGANPDEWWGGETAFLIAAGSRSNMVSFLVLLAGHGAEIEPKDRQGRTPLLRCAGRHIANMKFLLDLPHTDLSKQKDNVGWNLLTIAACEEDEATLIRVLKCHHWKIFELEETVEKMKWLSGCEKKRQILADHIKEKRNR